MIRLFLVSAAMCGVASLAVADATEPHVVARQQDMKTIGGGVKVLGDMAKGTVAFDAAKAQAAVEAIHAGAAEIPALFETEADDPESEAKPAIWQNWDDFTTKAKALETATAGLTIATAQDLGPAMGQIGGTCKACHSVYRE